MLNIEYTTQFKRDLKLAKKRNKKLNLLHNIVNQIANNKPLSIKLKDHILTGNWGGHRELHIEPDWLLIYKINKKFNEAIFVRTGSHSDLFR